MDGREQSRRNGQHGAASGAEVYAVTTWLATHPSAIVGAVGPDGLPVDLPPSLEVGPTRQVDDRSLLAIVAPEDASKVVATFQAALDRGVASVHVHLADALAGRATVHYFDLRSSHGVVLRSIEPDPGAGERGLSVSNAVAARPRLAVVHKDERSRICDIDAATSELLGWGRDEMVGRSTLEFVHPDDHPRAIDNWMAFMATGSRHSVRLRYHTKAGEWLWMETSNGFAGAGASARHVLCQMIDISEEMAATEALRHNEHLLRRLAETVPVGLAEIGPAGAVLFSNQTFRTLLGDRATGSPDGAATSARSPDDALLAAAVDDCLGAGIDSELDVCLPGGASTPARVCRVALRSLVEGGRTRGALLCVVDVTELKHRAATDALTGLSNRASIFETLSGALGHGPTGVIFIDLDAFKPINDRFGHEVGDRVLAQVGDALRASVRETDVVGRVGGDEFVVVCPEVSSPGGVLEIAARVKDAVTTCRLPDTAAAPLTASVGATWVPRASVSADAAVARADAAMYRAKRQRATGPLLVCTDDAPRAERSPERV